MKNRNGLFSNIKGGVGKKRLGNLYGRNLKMKYLWAFILVAMNLACSEKNTTEVIEIALNEKNPDVCCYTAILPENRTIRSYMLLVPGFGQTADNVLGATDLPLKAAQSEIAVFIPLLQDGKESYSFSSESQSTLKTIMADIRNRFELKESDYCIGGFSMGGSAAIRYAELTPDNPPVCVFAIDSPLDYERFRYSTERDVKIYKKGIANGDSIYIKLLEDITPIVKDSPYLLSDTTHQAILPLREIPIRYYIEPAEQWWLDNRQTDVLGLNLLDATAFINDLRLIGNNNAELIITSRKGYRNNGKTYHPHSWSIADSKNLIEWIIQCRDGVNAHGFD